MLLEICICWTTYGLKIVFGLLLLEMIFVRMIPQLYKQWFYQRQGIPFVAPVLPVFGNLIQVVRLLRVRPFVEYLPFYPLVKAQFGENPPGIVGLMHVCKPILIINKAEYLTDIFINKNKIVDKDRQAMWALISFLRESSLFAQASEEQVRRRKLLGSAFYKDRMVKMMDIIKNQVADEVERLEQKYLDTGKSFDIVQQLNDFQTRVILTAAFGQNVSDIQLDFIENGKTSKKPLGQILRILFLSLLFKNATYEVALLPYVALLFYRQSDREYLKNVKTLREFCTSLVEDRKKTINDHKEKPDVLTLLILDESYASRPDIIVDECITFFLAGSQTISSANVNTIQYLTMYPECHKKVMEEIKQKILNNYLDEHPGQPVNIRECFDYEKIQDLKYFTSCFYESMRIEPPVILSALNLLKETESINGIKFQKGDSFAISYQQLHHDPEQWIDHTKFIPDRFDNSSPYYLKPNGEKRHPLAFSPFFGGSRICIGKTFAEYVGKYVVTGILSRVSFEFENPQLMTQKPIINASMVDYPVVKMRMKRAKFE